MNLQLFYTTCDGKVIFSMTLFRCSYTGISDIKLQDLIYGSRRNWWCKELLVLSELDKNDANLTLFDLS